MPISNSPAANALDLSGQTFGRLTVMSRSGRSRGRQAVWLCSCTCGAETHVRATQLRKGKTKSCGCLKAERYHWTGYQEISGEFWSNQKTHAQSRGRSFTLSIEQAWELFVQQGRKCAYTGLPLTFSGCYHRDKAAQTASLDRIDSAGNYTSDNVQWVHKDVNMMKQKLSHERFIELCRLIGENQCRI